MRMTAQIRILLKYVSYFDNASFFLHCFTDFTYGYLLEAFLSNKATNISTSKIFSRKGYSGSLFRMRTTKFKMQHIISSDREKNQQTE